MKINHNDIVNSLSEKINLIISLYEQVKIEKQDLQVKNNVLKEDIKEKEREIYALKEQYKILKVAKSLSGADSGDNSDVKNKIGALVRDIDKCIALLNE